MSARTKGRFGSIVHSEAPSTPETPQPGFRICSRGETPPFGPASHTGNPCTAWRCVPVGVA